MAKKKLFAGRRASTNVVDQRGKRAEVRTTPKSDRLNPMGAKMISGMNKIEKVNNYARTRGQGLRVSQTMKDLGF